MIRPVAPADLPALLDLNNAHAAELSPLTPDALRALVGTAFRARVVGAAEAFLLLLDEAAAYDSPNHAWFRARFRRFAYVDRLAVSPRARGRGLARALYADAIAAAEAAGHAVLCAEVNTDPPNPASDALHASLGFAAVGRAALPDRGKVVRYLARPLAGGAAMPISRSMEQERKTAEPDAAPAPIAQQPKPKETGGPKGPEPTRFGDWEQKGRCTDF